MIPAHESARVCRPRRAQNAQPPHAHSGQGAGRFADRRHDPGAFRHFHWRTDEDRRAVARAPRGAGARRLCLGAAQPAARLAGDRAGVVLILSVPAAGREQGLKAIHCSSTGATLTTFNLASSEAAMTARPTTPIMMLQTAFISGFTPRRTSE